VTEPVADPAAEYAALAAIDDPVECARRITQIARTRGNLPASLARLRVQRLHEARTRDGRKVSWLAKQIGLGASGISRLTTKTTPEGAAA
jgi:hypothetical protein